MAAEGALTSIPPVPCSWADTLDSGGPFVLENSLDDKGLAKAAGCADAAPEMAIDNAHEKMAEAQRPEVVEVIEIDSPKGNAPPLTPAPTSLGGSSQNSDARNGFRVAESDKPSFVTYDTLDSIMSITMSQFNDKVVDGFLAKVVEQGKSTERDDVISKLEGKDREFYDMCKSRTNFDMRSRIGQDWSKAPESKVQRVQTTKRP